MKRSKTKVSETYRHSYAYSHSTDIPDHIHTCNYQRCLYISDHKERGFADIRRYLSQNIEYAKRS